MLRCHVSTHAVNISSNRLDVLKQSLGGFGGYATRFVDPALGFATGYAYFFKYLLATPNQLSAIALIIEVVNPSIHPVSMRGIFTLTLSISTGQETG